MLSCLLMENILFVDGKFSKYEFNIILCFRLYSNILFNAHSKTIYG